jgi:hypothetical protein
MNSMAPPGGPHPPGQEAIHKSRRRARWSLAAIALTIGSVVIASGLLATDAFASTPPRPANIPVGINLGGSATRVLEDATAATQNATFVAMHNSGLTELRVDIAFDTSEPQSGTFDWHQTSYVRRAIADHLQVDALLDYPPKWAILNTGSVSPKAFAAFAGAAAAHYTPLGVHLYELLNEPNRRAPGGARVDPVAYALLLRLSYPRIKAADPKNTVLLGGLADAANLANHTSLTMATFLTDVFKAGAAGAIDGVAVHPDSAPVLPMYPAKWNSFYNLPQLHQIMAAHGDGAMKIWLTEYGAATSGHYSVSYHQQAVADEEAYAQARKWGWIASIFYFNWQDNPADGTWGITTATGRPKPALSGIRQMLGRAADNKAVPSIIKPG